MQTAACEAGLPDSVKILDSRKTLPSSKGAIKNPVEVENERTAHIKDGVAVIKFITHEKRRKNQPSQSSASARQTIYLLLRKEQETSWTTADPIVSYAGYAAIITQLVVVETDILEPVFSRTFTSSSFFDTGGHRTTDIIWKVLLIAKNGCPGPVTEKEKYFTFVLKGHLNLAAKFCYGCMDLNLDYIAREPGCGS